MSDQTPTPIDQGRTTKRLGSALARKRRQQRNATEEFVLANTLDDDGNPTSALVRRPSILEADEFSALPSDIQGKIFDLIQQTQKAEGEGENITDQGMTDLAAQFGAAAHMADAYCLRGFVEPKLYATEAEADANDGVWVKDIHFNDRMAFMNWCNGARGAAAAEVAGFRDGSVDAAHAGPTGDAVSGPEVAQPRAETAAEV